MTKTEKIIKKADTLYQQMEWLRDKDNELLRVIIVDKAKDHDELLNLTFKVSKETSLSADSVYEFTRDALGTISDSTATTQEQLEEAGYEIEADPYTGQLTSWLNQNNNHVYYLTEALQEYGSDIDGFQLLALAQVQAKRDVYRIVLDWLIENI